MKKIMGEFAPKTKEGSQIKSELYDMQMALMPKYGHAWHRHSLVGVKVEGLARLLYYAELYEKIVDVPGVICEFGVQWGATMAELINLRSILEPFNYTRMIYGFDTFDGFPSVSEEDGGFSDVGDYSSTENHQETLEKLLQLHEAGAPNSHVKKFELVKGDASETIDVWLEENPHAIVSMAIFDMDIYQPTKDVLEKIIPRLTKGSVLVFDEINCKLFPGETIALREVVGTNTLRLKRSRKQPYCSWAVWGD